MSSPEPAAATADTGNMEALAPSLNAFANYLRHECGFSENTVAAYTRDLARFTAWLEAAQVTQWSALTVPRLGDYLAWLAEEKLAAPTVARHVASLKTFFRYLVLDEQITRSTAESLHRPSLWERLPHVLSDRQVDELLAAPSPPGDRLWRRDRALLRLLYATGTRASEVTSLQVGDVNLQERLVRCTGKGNKQRVVPFDTQTAATVAEYLAVERPKLNVADSNDLFLSRGGRAVTRIDLWKLVKKYAARLGLADRVSPHTLRHSFATHMLAQGVDLRVIQAMLGHASIATTQHYTRVEVSRLQAVHQRFHPRG